MSSPSKPVPPGTPPPSPPPGGPTGPTPTGPAPRATFPDFATGTAFFAMPRHRRTRDQ